MRIRIQDERGSAFGLLEVLVIIVLLAILAITLLPAFSGPKRHTRGINCVTNLKQINLALRIWAGDNNNQWPMSVSVTNGGAMELMETGNIVGCFQIASNEMSTTKILVCPDDPARTFATNFDDLNSLHVSYFLSVDATEERPETILDGDDNLEMNGSSIKSGLFYFSSNSLVAWAPGRHNFIERPHFWSFPKAVYLGNIGFADGSVEQFLTWQLRKQIQYIDPETNRIAIP